MIGKLKNSGQKKNCFWRIVHTQVDYYNMLLVRELGNDNKAEQN